MTVDYTQFDAETYVPGQQQYISPTWDRSDDEADLAHELAVGFIAAVIILKGNDIWSALSKKWSDRGFKEDDLAPLHTRLVGALKSRLGDALVRAAGLGREQALADFEAEFPARDWRSIATTWSQVYGNEMANQIADQSSKGLANVIPTLINKGLRGDVLANQVKVFYGLDPRSTNSLLNFLDRKEKPRNQTALDVAQQLLTRRGKVIGDVQSFTGLNFGRQMTYMEAMDAGLLPKSARKVWVTAIDERVCKVCKPMDGVAVGLLDTFTIKTSAGDIKLLVPPVHPNCRCTVVPEERYRYGLITRRARFRDEGQAHRSRLRSEIEDLVSLGKAAGEASRQEDVAKWWFHDVSNEARDQSGKWTSGAKTGVQNFYHHHQDAFAAVGYSAGAAAIYVGLSVDPKLLTKVPNIVEDAEHFANVTDDDLYQAANFMNRATSTTGNLKGKAPVPTPVMNAIKQEVNSWTGKYANSQGVDAATEYPFLSNLVTHAEPEAPLLMRGFAFDEIYHGKYPQFVKMMENLKGERDDFDLPLMSWTTKYDTAKKFAVNNTGRKVIFHLEPGAKAVNIQGYSHFKEEAEWLTLGHFRVSKVEEQGQFLHIHLTQLSHELQGKVNKALMAGFDPVEKFNPLQARDILGRFAPVAAAGTAAYVGATQFPRVKDEQPKLPSHLKRVDRKVKSVRPGTYLVPRQYLDFHQRGQSFRFGNEAHINDMAREMRQRGYRMQPVTLHVYDNAVEVADGNHRVEAAYRAKVGFLPVKIVRYDGKKPKVHGVIPAWRQARTNEARRLAASRYVGSLEESSRNPFRRLNQRLISQDERKHGWHDKSRKRTIKPL